MIDSHAHLSSPDLDLEPMLERAQQAGVEKIVNICTELSELERGIEIKRSHPNVYNVGSTTPHDVDKLGELEFSGFTEHARAGHLVGIGETGLDYYYEHADRSLQQEFLRRYLGLAGEVDLPVVIHCREAFADFFRILDEEGYKGPGILHCFTGTLDEAKEVIARGWYLSLSGIVTFKKSEILREVARVVPLKQLLIETDTPYLAPTPYRGKQNEPAYLVHTATCVAEERGMSLSWLDAMTTSNTEKVFRLSPQ